MVILISLMFDEDCPVTVGALKNKLAIAQNLPRNILDHLESRTWN